METALTCDDAGGAVVDEKRRAEEIGKGDGGRLSAIERLNECRIGRDVLEPNPSGCGDLSRAGEPGTGHDDLVVDDPRDNDLSVELPQKLELTCATEVDQRTRVRDDDHPQPSERISSSNPRRSSR